MHWLASSSYNIWMRKVLILSVSPPPSLFLFSLYLSPSLPPFHPLSHSLFHFLYLSLYLTCSLCFTWKNYSVFFFSRISKEKKNVLKKVEISDYRLMLIWYSRSFLHIPTKLNGIKIGNIFRNCINRNTFF